MFTPEKRSQIAELVLTLLEQDERIDAALVVGSMATEPDRWSDIDVALVVSDGADHVVVAADWLGRLYEELPIVHHFETAFGKSLVFGFLLDDLLELDLSFTPRHDFSVWGPARVAFDRSGGLAPATSEAWDPPAPEWAAEAGFAWHDILHACAAARRGRLWQSLWYLERIRNRTLRLSQERRGWDADFFDRADDLPAEELAPFEATLVARIEPEELLDAIENATAAFLTELRRGERNLADRLESPLKSIFSL